MVENIKPYMVILLNPRTGAATGAFRTDLETTVLEKTGLEKINENLTSIRLEKLKEIPAEEKYPDLEHIKRTDCIMALQTKSTPRLWIYVNRRWVYLG